MDPLTFRASDGRSNESLDVLLKLGPLTPKLQVIHTLVKRRFNFVDRIAVVLFDDYSSNLKTFISTNAKDDPLVRYEFSLAQARSLLETMVKGPRVVNDLSVFSKGAHEHTRRIQEFGFQASYTVPLFYDHVFRGFIFMNSNQKDCFSEEIVEEIDVYCHLISSAIERDISGIRTLNGALNLAAEFLRIQNTETESRMGRMTRITRLILEELVAAGKCKFDDEGIERLSRYAAFHDIGKVAVPESILMKPERLSMQEFAIASTHTERGLEIIDSIVKNFNLKSMSGIEVLRNIVLSHHERIDGSGYPFRLREEQIPIEARIVAVADIYDALTSNRPYRSAFTSEEAFALLHENARKLDADCLAALVRGREKLEALI
jgi:HD-GYP domain-containing protein (c-di-GMP phosphodiesterase class II)